MYLKEYEKLALKEIRAWKNPKLTWYGQAMQIVNWPLEKAGDAVFKTPGVGDALRSTINGIVNICNDVAHWSVKPNAIYKEFEKEGNCKILRADDICSLEMENIDRVVGWLSLKYKGIALAEGAGTGAIGLPGIAADLFALVSLNLRAIGEYATYYGFDINSQAERLFALNVMSLASSPTDASKNIAMAQLVKISRDVARKRTWEQLEKNYLVKIINKIATSLGYRLTKAKLAQIIPYAGAVIGGGFNAYFTSNVCEASFYLYRERFLAKKYGEDIIQLTTEPADSLDPDYPDDDLPD